MGENMEKGEFFLKIANIYYLLQLYLFHMPVVMLKILQDMYYRLYV